MLHDIALHYTKLHYTTQNAVLRIEGTSSPQLEGGNRRKDCSIITERTCTAYTHAVRTSQETHHLSATEPNRLML
jgi:hypothetical protein